MRNAFIDELVKLASINKNIALIVGDLGYSVVEPFADTFPDRFFNAGVAEQNMTAVAAGMASEGYHVFTYSIANFPVLRCAEQIRNDVDYHKLAVTIVAVGGGLAYGNLGYSHHAVQDYSFMRSLPNMLIASPGDPLEVRSCLNYLINNPQPSYLRLGKAGEKIIHSTMPEVHPGKWLKIIETNEDRNTYLTTGATLEMVYNMLQKNNPPNFSLSSMPLWSMSSKKNQIGQIEHYEKIISVEDHLLDGGFGSWLLESTVNRRDLINRLSIKSLDALVCGVVGNQASLNSKYGLSEEDISIF